MATYNNTIRVYDDAVFDLYVHTDSWEETPYELRLVLFPLQLAWNPMEYQVLLLAYVDNSYTQVYSNLERFTYNTPNETTLFCSDWTRVYRLGLLGETNSWYDIVLAPDSVKLAAPTGLTSDTITSTSARVSWNAVENATDYKVEYRKQGDTTWNE